jgi:ISXO2 transposase-like protein/transposase-like zinc ribbon protein
VASRPLASVHYPKSTGEFQSWFPTDADCLDYLAWLRWPGGFACPGCGHPAGWRLADGRMMCRACFLRVSPMAGTIFDRTRTPLTVWFTACWLFATQKDGVSALSLQKNLEIGSYQTAWALLHRLRSVLVRPGRERLVGAVEVDETDVGGEEPGVHLGRAKGKKSMVGIAVERIGARASGRCRMALLCDASAASLRAFLCDHVDEGSTVVSDGWAPYRSATAGLYVHRPLIGHGPAGSKLLPRVHRVAALAKRWMLGTHQGSIGTDHLASYLNEFVFRFNRRRSRSPGLVFYRVLELAVLHEPVRYRDLIAHTKSGVAPSPPPRTFRHPASLERSRADRPWRSAPSISSG